MGFGAFWRALASIWACWWVWTFRICQESVIDAGNSCSESWLIYAFFCLEPTNKLNFLVPLFLFPSHFICKFWLRSIYGLFIYSAFLIHSFLSLELCCEMHENETFQMFFHSVNGGAEMFFFGWVQEWDVVRVSVCGQTTGLKWPNNVLYNPTGFHGNVLCFHRDCSRAYTSLHTFKTRSERNAMLHK